MIAAISSRGVSFHPIQKNLSELTTRILEWSTQHFSLIEGVCFFFYGMKELLYDGIFADRQIKPLKNDATPTEKKIHKIKKEMAYLFKVHGALYATSAIGYCCFPSSHFLSDGLFLYANVLGLIYHVDLYYKAAQLPDKIAQKFKWTAVLGVLNSISYILAAATVLLGGTGALALTFGGIALAFGGTKVLYDFFMLKK